MALLRAVVAGGSGLVGRYCLEQLLRDERYGRVTALVRRRLAMDHAKLTQLAVDFEKLEQASLEADHWFCALGTTIRKAGSQAAFRKVDHDYPAALAMLAAKGNAAAFVLVSSVGAELNSPNFYLRVKGETEVAVTAAPVGAVHILRPSILMGDREEFRLGERIGIGFARTFQFLLFGAMRRYRPIEARQVAAAMVAAANRGEAGRFIHHYDQLMTAK